MGSGNRIKIYTTGRWSRFGLGMYVDNFPFTVNIALQLMWFTIELGFGKGYDQ